LYIDFDSSAPIQYANKWKGAIRGFGKIKENLQILGIEFEEIPQAIELINEQKERISQELSNIIQQFPAKLQELTLAKEERLVIQPTIQQRVDEFSAYNYILHEVVPTLPMDREKFVEVPDEKLAIVPNVKEIEKVIEEAVIEKEEPKIEEEVGVDTSELIANLQNGLLVRFNFGLKKKGKKVVDLFFEEGDLIKFSAFENSIGEIVEEEGEEVLNEREVIEFYKKYYDKISEQFYDDGTGVEEEIIPAEKEIIEVSKVELYNQLIEGYELALELETDEEKIKMYNDLIEGYQLALELEN
jgi:hypothetical protein